MSVCTSCGARLKPSTLQCDLCGASAGDSIFDFEEVPVVENPEVVDDSDATESEVSAVFCISCGSESPAHAKFCWKCGAALVKPQPTGTSRPMVKAVKPESSPKVEAERSDAGGRQAILLVAGAAVLIVVLFVATLLGGRQNTLVSPEEMAASASAATAPTNPSISREVSARIAFLEREVAEAPDDETRIAMHQALVQELIRAELFGSAGEAQEELAQELDTAEAWADAGAFYFAQMLRTDPTSQSFFAERAIRAYERSLELEPGNLDVMTDLASSYLRSPNNPMHGVELVQEVLEIDPNHARARFNYALMLIQIGRDEQAADELRRVIGITESGDIIHDRATAELQRMGL